MKKIKETVFVCSNCGNEFGKWMGQCSVCGEWNSLKEVKSLEKPILSKSRRVGEKIEVKNLSKIPFRA